MKIIPLSVAEAHKFLGKHARHYATIAQPIWAVGLQDEKGKLRGAAVLGRRADGDAELAHIYCDGAYQGYTLLYGTSWRALKAMGFEKAAL